MITVLMSTYNGEKYLREQIDSILMQSYSDILLFIRDDGSSDSTQEIINDYALKYPNKVKWYAGLNLGCCKSFFQLMKDAPPSDYYAFADQDDLWYPDKLITAAFALSMYSEEKCALYCSATNPVDSNLIPLKTSKKKHKEIKYTFGLSLMQNIASGCTYVFNRALLENALMLDASSVDIHDWTLIRVVMALDGNLYYDSTPHIDYRQHGNNAIGWQSGMQKWKRRFTRLIDKRSIGVRSRLTYLFYKTFKDSMPAQNLKIAEMIINAQFSFRSRLKLVFNSDFRMVSLTDTAVIKIIELLGLL